MKISSLLGKILSEGLLLAKKNNHQYFSPEHVLYVAFDNEIVREIMEECNVDTQAVQEKLKDYLGSRIPSFSEKNKDKNPIETMGFQAVMNRAVFLCVESERSVVDVTDVLLSMFDERRNYCSYYLKNAGLTRDVLSEAIDKFKQGQKGKSIEAAPNMEPQETNIRQSHKSNLDKYCIDMIEQYKKGEFDCLIGREDEIERTIQVLLRRVKNNPLHVGDSGVGKTAVTQGLVQRIVENRVPEALKGCKVFSLDLGLLLAGAKFRGDFEERIHSVVDELIEMKNSILFIDEIHMIMGAGTNGNSNIDAANLLKPVLSSGKLRVIGSTTFEEYSKNFEKDRALVRRFQKIDINEPSRDESVRILTGLLPRYEKFHGVRYQKSAIELAVDLSIQYLADKRLPDKAIDVIDESGSLVRIKNTGGFYGYPMYANISNENMNAALMMEEDDGKQLPVVNNTIIRKVVAKMAHVPLDSIQQGDKGQLKNLQHTLETQIFGQDKAVNMVVKAVKRSRAGLKNPQKPDASFLFVGPTGVGKTELAKTLAESLGEPLIRFDMSEYQEKHTVSRLLGAPAGYVGYDEGGLLTDAIRKTPHAVVLFDEIEKAHQDIYNIFLQMLDYGFITDNKGRRADFRNCIIIMTSNAGARDLEKRSVGFDSDDFETDLLDDEINLKAAVEKEFAPEFRNRLDGIVPFGHLSREVVLNVINKECNILSKRLASKKVTLKVTDECKNYLAEIGYSKEFGARNLSRTIDEKISSPLVDEVLFGKLSKGGAVIVNLEKTGITFTFGTKDGNFDHDSRMSIPLEMGFEV